MTRRLAGHRWMLRPWSVMLLWEPRDLWVGVYWTTAEDARHRYLAVYVCVVPLLPVRFTFRIGDALAPEGSE